MDEAWKQVYGHIAQIFNHIISTGKNMVSRALATGNPDELRRALSTAGRKARVLAPLEIETDDSIISPIVWTLQVLWPLHRRRRPSPALCPPPPPPPPGRAFSGANALGLLLTPSLPLVLLRRARCR